MLLVTVRRWLKQIHITMHILYAVIFDQDYGSGLLRANVSPIG